jgi:uncharacterized membrane protein YhaH (DUF805 family)
MNWYLKVLKQFVDFAGRARRQEFWMFVLFNAIFACVAMALDNVFGIANPVFHYGPLYGIYGLVVLLPSLAVTVRRLHDIGKSGLMILIALIPIVGGIWLLVLMCKAGVRGANQYGADPKEIETA